MRYEHTQLNIVQYTAHLTLTVNLKTPLISDDYQYGTNILSISISDVYNWCDFSTLIHFFHSTVVWIGTCVDVSTACVCLCINGKPFTCTVHLWVQYTAGLWYRRALSAFWKAHHASGFGHSIALIEACWCAFCHSQETAGLS